MRRFLLGLVIIFACVACGGGGGGADNDGRNREDVPFFGGVWEGNAFLVRNDCNLDGMQDSFSFMHTVNQVGTTVVLDVLGGATFSGTVDDDKQGFTVIGPESSSGQCSGRAGISYSDVDLRKGTAGVAQLILTRCLGGLECQVGWVGEVVRR